MSPTAHARLALIPLLLGACGPTPTTAAPEGPRRSVDLGEGRTLEVPAEPLRVLPVTSAAVDIVVALLPPERIAALPRAALFWSGLAEDPGPWAEHTILEGFSGEEVLTLGPDLVIAASWSDPAAVGSIHEANIPVLVLPDAESWEELVGTVDLLGRALGREEQANELIAGLEQRKSALAGTSRPRWKVLPYSNFGAGGRTSGAGTTLDLVIGLAGLENAAALAGIPRHGTVDLEQVLAIDPDVFLTATGNDGVDPGASFLRNEEVLASLRAITRDRILVLPAELFSTSSHHVLDAAEELARQVDALVAGDE